MSYSRSIKSLLFIAIWFVLIAAQAKIKIYDIPAKDYPAGVYSIPSTSVPNNASIMILTIDRTNWLDPKVTIDFRLDLSPDDGKTWMTGDNNAGWCAFTASGGAVGKPPVPATVMECECSALANCDPANPDNRVRGSITVSGGTMNAGGTIEVR